MNVLRKTKRVCSCLFFKAALGGKDHGLVGLELKGTLEGYLVQPFYFTEAQKDRVTSLSGRFEPRFSDFKPSILSTMPSCLPKRAKEEIVQMTGVDELMIMNKGEKAELHNSSFYFLFQGKVSLDWER